MQELLKRAESLSDKVTSALKKLRIDDLKEERDDLKNQSTSSDFWIDNKLAGEKMQRLSELDAQIEPWDELKKLVRDTLELIKTNDQTLSSDLAQNLDQAEGKLNDLSEQLRYSGPLDDHSAILNIYAGAGGTDAQDWAQMLLRMYLRWAERKGYKTEIISQSSGEEAGLKSVSVGVLAPHSYGLLKGENGVHRLVRLSPFNADHLRQTSFAKVEVMPRIDKPDEIALDEKDLKIDVFRSGGHGGQSVNTTDSAVRVTHIPSSITVTIQNERSQIQNRQMAMTILRSRLAQLQLEQHQADLNKIKGPNLSAEWGNQIRSYVLHPYKQVKDLRTKYESSNPNDILDGEIDELIGSYANYSQE
ncbi:MAG TPA: peptide chain release factor 2 [Candidatus Saccharimonadales bacterium]|nr:peptide chain release factor 2 [Candidatus Saccharimonadales bacterium]